MKAKMCIIDKYLSRYLMCSIAYGFVRKIDDLVDARVYIREWDKEACEHFDRPVSMLYTDRLMVLGISALASPFMLPKYLYDDLSWVEIRMRDLDPYDYGHDKKRSVLHYLF